MHHAGIGFLPEGFHPLHRFLSLINAWLASWILCSQRVRSSGTVYCARIVSSDSSQLSKVRRGGRKGRQWHVAAAVIPWQGLGEPPELRTPAMVPASTWQRPLSWKHREGQVDVRHIRAFNPGCHRVRARVRVIYSAASSGGQGQVVRHHFGVGVAVWAWSCRRHGC